MNRSLRLWPSDLQFYMGIYLKLGSEIAGRLCQLGFIVLVARSLGPGLFGLYSLGIFWGFLAGQLADGGLHLLINREEVKTKGYLAKSALLVKIRLALILAPALILVSFAVTTDPLEVLAIWAVAYSFVVYSFAEYGFSLLRAQGQLAQEAAIALTGRVLLLVIALGGNWIGFSGLGWVSLVQVAVNFSVAGQTLYFTRPLWSSAPSSSGELLWKTWKRAFPFGLGLILSLLAFRVDMMIMGIFRNEAEVGNYSAAYRLFEPCLMLPAVIMAGWFPRLVKATLLPDRFKELSRKLLLLLGGLAVIVMGFLILFSGWVIEWLYGSSYSAGAGLLALLALVIPIIYLNYGLTHMLIAQGLEKFNTLFFGLALVINITVNLIAIPLWGGTGAALVTLLTELVLLTLCYSKLLIGAR